MIARVMIVDDDPLIRRAISGALARAGFEVCTAEDAGPAMVLADIAQPDLAIIDYQMPTCGLEVVRAMKQKRGAGVYVAVLTGSDNVSEECRAAGADAVLEKPILPSELKKRLMAALAIRAAS